MLLAAILPLGLFLFPLWKITLEAPQYPTPLGMYIHINDFSDASFTVRRGDRIAGGFGQVTQGSVGQLARICSTITKRRQTRDNSIPWSSHQSL